MQPQDLLADDQNHVLRDGIVVRKGSVGAFLINANVLADPHATPAVRAAAERDLLALVPALRAIGLFDVFAARDRALQQLIERG